MAATVAITKIIGFVYKIPLYNWLGDEGTHHFQVMYTIYNLLLTVSTAGIPVALSRLISSADTTGRPMQVKRYFSVGLAVFTVVGIVGSAAMFIFARQLSNFMGDYEIVTGVRVLAPAVLFACLVSVYRGYSQGFGNMVPTSISQIMEVGCKLLFGLPIAWILLRKGMASAQLAAGAIVGVTVGLALAIPILMWYKRRMDSARAGPLVDPDVPSGRLETAEKILRISLPITLGSSIMNIISLIDTKLILERLEYGAGLSYAATKTLNGVYSKGLALFNMPAAFITPVAVSVVPFIAAAIAKREHGEAKNIMESSLKLTSLLGMPAAVGLCVLAKPIFNVLYVNSHEIGPSLLSVLGIASYFVCTYIVTNALLQASGHESIALLALPAGGIVKIAANWVLVGNPSVNISGAPVSTLMCYFVITAMNFIFIAAKVKERPSFTRACLRPLICSLIMGAVAWGSYALISRVGFKLLGTGRIAIMLCLAATIIVAVVVYGVLIVVTKTVTQEDMKLVPKGDKIAKLLKIR